ncbi:MAG: phospholipid carrier-dependent glycosyltransferase [Aquificaceae bacterium]
MLYLLSLLVFALYLLNLGSFQVWSPNEAFYADSTRNMLKGGDFLNPYYNGDLRLNKPPMTYWLVAIGYSLFGVNEWGLRFMHALLGLLTGFITLLIAKEITKSWYIGVFSFLVFSLSVQFFANSQYASPEVPFTFFITLSLYLWLLYYNRKNFLYLPFAFLSSSFAMLVKGPAGFVIPAGVVFFYLLLRDPKELLKLRYYLLSLFALLLGLWWHVYQLLTKGSQFWEVFYKENLQRIHHGDDPIYFYLLDLNVSFLPYSFIFFIALAWTLVKAKREMAFPIVWFAFVYGLFSFISQKIPVYVLPAFPSLAIITANFMVGQDWTKIKKYSSLFISLLIALTLLIATFFFSLPLYFLLLLPLPFLVFYKDYKSSPAMAGLILVIFLKFALLPQLEEKRKVKDLGEFIKGLDPKGETPIYEVGYFHHSLPFYAERKIIRDKEPQRGSLVVFSLGSFEKCQPIKTFSLYTGSESRLFKFIMDAKRGKNFKEFGVCFY